MPIRTARVEPPADRRAALHHASSDPRELQLVVLQLDVDGIAVREVAIEDQPCQRIFDQRLDRALQWPRTVHRIEAGLGELVERGLAERQRDAAFDTAPAAALRLDSSSERRRGG